MGVQHGRTGKVKIGANIVAEVQNFDLKRTTKIEEYDSMGDTSVTRQAGIDDSSGSLNCLYDLADTNGQVVLKNGASVTLLLYPEDDTSGKIEITVPAIISEFNITVAKDTFNIAQFSFVGNGDVTEAAVV